jgi:hypothetical protein
VVEWSGGGTTLASHAGETDRGGGDEVGKRWISLEVAAPFIPRRPGLRRHGPNGPGRRGHRSVAKPGHRCRGPVPVGPVPGRRGPNFVLMFFNIFL